MFVCSGIDELYQDSTRLFNDEAIIKQQIHFSHPLSAMILAPKNFIFIVPKHLKLLCKLPLPDVEEKVFVTTVRYMNASCV